jgi:hypothetical protein
MWRLPYWDPSRQLVVDPMHCILEGLVQHHSRTLLGLTTATTSSSSTLPPPAFSCDLGDMPPGMTSKEMTQVAAICTLLVSQLLSDDENLDNLKNSLFRKNTGPLKFVCEALRCAPKKSSRLFKINYVKALVEWVSS